MELRGIRRNQLLETLIFACFPCEPERRKKEMATLVVPDTVPSPREDAENIRNAVKGFGTNEKVIIAILGHRNAEQRKHIRLTYEELYNEDLIKRLESELSGDFEKAVYRWILDPAERDAIIAHTAMNTLNRDYKVIIEIATELSPDELFAVKQVYQKRFKTSLEEDVASHTYGDLRKILVALVSTYRYNGDEVNIHLAASEANVLQKAIEEKEFIHEEVIRILSTRSKAQLNATFNRYRDNNGVSISKKLVGEVELAGGFAEALHTTIGCIIHPAKYFEKVIRSALNKSGTDEDALTRVIVCHAERNLGEIKDIYQKRNSVPLDKAVANETSGDYEAFLLTLLGSK